GVAAVKENDDIMLISTSGMVNRTHVREIRVSGRNTQGVRVINLKAGDKLAALAPVAHEEDVPEEPTAAPPSPEAQQRQYGIHAEAERRREKRRTKRVKWENTCSLFTLFFLLISLRLCVSAPLRECLLFSQEGPHAAALDAQPALGEPSNRFRIRLALLLED